ncbi:MAG: hypothetical protein ACW981_17075 [Candidatus Hodarchaeales archaeon]
MDFTEISKQIAIELEKNGWGGIKFSAKLPNSSGTFDVVAKSKGFRKRQLVISIGSDPNDATIASMLLNGLDDKFLKVIYLAYGDPRFVSAPSDIKIINDLTQIPKA